MLSCLVQSNQIGKASLMDAILGVPKKQKLSRIIDSWKRVGVFT